MRLNLRNLVNSKNLREAITQKLADMLKNIDVVKDNEFKSSNGVLNGMLKKRVMEGTSIPTQHKHMIEKVT